MGSAGKIFATMLLHFVIPFNLICNMTRAHPVISHCSHLLLKMLSGYKYKSLAKSTRVGSHVVSVRIHCTEKMADFFSHRYFKQK